MQITRRRYRRYETERPAAVAVGIRIYPGTIRNISLGGMCVSTPAQVEVGDEIVVRDKSGGVASRCRVAWAAEGRVGLEFILDDLAAAV